MKLFNLAIIISLIYPLYAQTGEEILRKVDKAISGELSFSLVKQIVQTSGGRERQFLIEVYQKDYGKKMLFRYLKPARIEGTSFLFTEDGIWGYFPRTGRIRKIAPGARRRKMMGSSFTYEDVLMLRNLHKRYDVKSLGSEDLNGKSYLVLELIPKEKRSAYDLLILHVRENDYIPVMIEFYKRDGKLVKRLRQDDIQIIEGRATPMRIVMEDLKDKSITVMELQKISYSISLPDNFFSIRELRRRK
jgi:outer membrane lipoprotein-sorting protein